MRRTSQISPTFLAALMLLWSAFGWSEYVLADTANAPSLIISQLKITSSNGQFVTLYNTTNSALDMSRYQLEYFNNYDLGKATSSRLISLSGTVPPHGYYLVNDNAMMLCYQLTVDSVSLGFSSTAGMVEVLAYGQSSVGSAATPTLQDFVGWSKTAANGVQALPANTSAFLQRQPVDGSNNPIVSSSGAGSWQNVQPDGSNACNLVTSAGTLPVAIGLTQLLPPTEAPATIVNLSEDSSDAPSTPTLPAADIGLMAPQVTELLPNPDGTGNNSTDEFIEIYNPNASSFDLSGFQLQSGIKAFHYYTFQAGTTLPPNSFTAFYSEQTGLSLSNTSGMVKLLDPFGSSISASPAYTNAKDGQAWAVAGSKWFWTTALTPNAANVIKQPVAAKKKTATSTKSSKTTSAKTATPKATKTTASSVGSPNSQAPTTPIHLRTLALVVGLALLYGIYEYRADLANRVFQLRQYFKARRPGRAQT
jgi:predicted extracellular nuclease